MRKIAKAGIVVACYLIQIFSLSGCGALETTSALLDTASEVDSMAYTNDDIEFGRKPASYGKMQFQNNVPSLKAGDKIGNCYIINRSGKCHIRHIESHTKVSDTYDCRDSKNLTGTMLSLVESNKCD